jgi:hypothetical protein
MTCEEALRICPQLMVRLLRYSQVATMEVTQITACNRLHEVEERLARWLLMGHDRIGSDRLPTHPRVSCANVRDSMRKRHSSRRCSTTRRANPLPSRSCINSEPAGSRKCLLRVLRSYKAAVG